MPFSRSQIALLDGKTTISAFPPSASSGKKLRSPCRTVRSRSETPKAACALDSSRRSSHLLTGLPGTDASGRSTTRRWACEIVRINGEIGVYSMMSFTKAKISLARESLCACGKGARSLHSEVRKLSFVAGWSRAKPKKGLVKLASRGLFFSACLVPPFWLLLFLSLPCASSAREAQQSAAGPCPQAS